jgi:hypothetical protein
MLTEEYLVIGLVVIVVAFVIRRLIATADAWKFHGTMLVTCPENHKAAAVKPSLVRAVAGEFIKHPDLELTSCSRWPERLDCDQTCLFQVEQGPDQHRVWDIATKWFEGKKCAMCSKPIEAVSHLDHAPALMTIADRKTVEWRDLPAEQLPEAFAKCLPLCWSCHMTETFLRKFPDRAVIRPYHREI